MKKIVIMALFIFSGMLFSQEVKPKFEIVNNLVKATYYYDNGQIMQQGFYLDGKLHGKWVSFREDGDKKVMGEYENGKKTGKWFFWEVNELSEVDYNQSKIKEVKKWSEEVLVKS